MICVIGGGEWQAPLISSIQKKGHQVLCVNLYSDTSGSQLADFFEYADIKNKDQCFNAIKKYKDKIKAVVTDQSDIAVGTVAYISEQLGGLKSIGETTAKRFTDKYLMRVICKELNLPNPSFCLVNNKLEVENFIQTFGLPVVLKPRNSQSSKGISIIKSHDQIESSLCNAMLESHEFDNVLIEQYIGGIEYTVEGYSRNFKNTTIAYSEKSHYEDCKQVAESLTYPGNLSTNERLKLFKTCEMIVDSLGLKFGITHAEFKYHKGEFYLIEVAARGGGTKISSHIVPTISNFNLYDILLDDLLKDNVDDFNYNYTENGIVRLKFLNFLSGKVLDCISVDKIIAHDRIIDFNYNFNIGEDIQSVKDDRSRHAHLIVHYDNEDNLNRNIKTIEDNIVNGIKYE
ncbi:ATP-grasp domain-containing protein [Aliivibrio fischeri]|uniref:Carbamoyl-phosphate synthase large chain n=1 Tax=Aliivibrio fischeri SR5 TaxID=1088719 RepID=A0AAV3EXP9_ALIFS|nr:ATP-grasp domain-containing protein [Aliivibrio fischeri]EHN71547.1 putative carbamoyl-phosphate synthase large chain [Aliivibrio fischeri SR5]